MIMVTSTQKPWKVHKFGGTSVGTGDRLNNVADIIASEMKTSHRPCIVSSAMSSLVKNSGTTTRFQLIGYMGLS
jgi:aspartate kinase